MTGRTGFSPSDGRRVVPAGGRAAPRSAATAVIFLLALALGAGAWAQALAGGESAPAAGGTPPASEIDLSAAGVSAGGMSAAGSPLPSELEGTLLRVGWDPRAVQELRKRGLDWGQFRARDVAVLERALRYARRENEALAPGEQAVLALEICRASREMEALGYGEIDIARTVFTAVRASVGNGAAGRGDGEAEDRGEEIRSRFRRELRAEAAEQTRMRVREGIQGDGARGGGPGPGRGPAGAPGRS
jgi:hypothetical protein